MKSDSEKLYLATYNIHDFEVPLTVVDMSIFAIINKQLHVLLVKRNDHPFKGIYALPGGFINMKDDADIEGTAHRKLFEKTGISSPYLEQVSTIGNKTRDPRGWSVTILYFALINYLSVRPIEEKEEDVKWYPLKEAYKKKLAFDHNLLLITAANRLKSKTRYTALPVSLMPPLFTLTELQSIFEIILDVKLQKKAFRKRLLDSNAVQGTEESKIVGKRPAQLYRAISLPGDLEFPRAIELHKH